MFGPPPIVTVVKEAKFVAPGRWPGRAHVVEVIHRFRRLPYMTSSLEGGGGTQKADKMNEVA